MFRSASFSPFSSVLRRRSLLAVLRGCRASVSLKQGLQNKVRIGVNDAVHASSILEYLSSDAMELAGASRDLLSPLPLPHPHLVVMARVLRVKLIMHPYIQPIWGDEVLNSLILAETASGGALPFIHRVRLLEGLRNQKGRRRNVHSADFISLTLDGG